MGGLFAFSGEIALFVCISSTWKLDGFCQDRIRLDIPFAIQSELPGTAQVHMFRLILCLNTQAEDSHQ